MEAVDYAIIVFYFVLMMGLGFWYRERASRDVEAYFLGSRSLHWLALAMSGASAHFDVTGTMWIVSIIFLLGMRSMWHHWMWGFLMGAFFMSYMGKWVRRSSVLTAAEWMVTRFGSGRAGVAARTVYAVMAVVTLASFIGYAYQGIGKFASVYLNLAPATCAVIIISTTTFYVMLGGLFSVVYTQVAQTVVMMLSSIFIAVIAYVKLTPDVIAGLPEGFASILPVWRLEEFAGSAENAQFELFGVMVVVWVIKGLLLNVGGPAQMYDFQTFLAARSPRDASMLGAAWSFFLIVRWAFCMGVALLALAGIAQVSDSEKVMPIVLREYLPAGVRGLVVAGLFAAFMSTFSATINGAASFVIRDIWQPFFRPAASQRHLVSCGRVATVVVVLLGIFIGRQVRSIADIWNWIMMALGAAVIIPNALRWYWWRMTGWGFAFAALVGFILSVVAFPRIGVDLPPYIVFAVICLGSLVTAVLVSLFTEPVDEQVLFRFYSTVRPFGFWGPVRHKVGLSKSGDKSEKASLAVFNTVVGMVAIAGYYLFPMYLVGHWHLYAGICLGVALAATAVLARTWYRYLPEE